MFLKNLCYICCCCSFLIGCETIKKTYTVIADPDAKVITNDKVRIVEDPKVRIVEDPKVRIVEDPKVRIVEDPKIKIGKRIDQPSEFSISIYATKWININEFAESTTGDSIAEKDFSDSESTDEKDFSAEKTKYSKKIKTSKKTIKNLRKKPTNWKNLAPKDDIDPTQATPVKLNIVQLSEKSLFLSATYDELLDDAIKKTLGTNYLGHENLMIDPDQFRFFEKKPVKEGTRYIGIIAYFNDESSKQWRDVVKVQSNGEIYPLFVRISERLVKIYKDN